MKLAITIYPDDFAQADRVIHLLRQERSLELDGYMGKQHYDKNFDKPRFSGRESGAGDSTENVDNDTSEVSHPTARPNINPGDPTTTKIGQATADIIVAELEAGRQPGSKYTEALKLLWSRGKVKFDGHAYYL